MNQRIKELEPQCWEHNEFGLNFNYQKFAELIVRECARINFSNIVGIDPEDDAAVGRAIKKHFGVEE